MNTTELFVHMDGSPEPLVRLQGLVSAVDVAYMGYDRDELLIDVGEVACEFVHQLNNWRPTQRKNMPPVHELKYAIVRYAKEHGTDETVAHLKMWLAGLDNEIMKEALE